MHRTTSMSAHVHVQAPTTAVTDSAKASDHCRMGATPALCHASCPSTEYAGRGAGRTNASDDVGSTRARSCPSSRKISCVKANHVVSPEDVPFTIASGSCV